MRFFHKSDREGYAGTKITNRLMGSATKGLVTVVAVSVLLLGALLLAGCSSQTNQASTTGNDGKEQKIVVKFGHNAVTDSPEHRSAEAFKQKLEALSQGKMVVEIYPNQQLGQMREQVEQVVSGTLQVTLQPVSVLSNFDSRLEVLDIPFLFTDPNNMFNILDGAPGKKLLAGLEEKGLVGLGFQLAGMKQITANKTIKTPSDLRGLKMRTIPAPVVVKTYEAFGANPTPIDYSELYNALQQGVVDGQENPPLAIEQQKFYEVQKSLTLTNHGAFLYIVVTNKKWFDGLPGDLQQKMREAMAYAIDLERKEVTSQEADAVKRLEEKGMQVYRPSESEIKAFQEASQPVVDFVKSRVGAEIVDLFLRK